MENTGSCTSCSNCRVALSKFSGSAAVSDTVLGLKRTALRLGASWARVWDPILVGDYFIIYAVQGVLPIKQTIYIYIHIYNYIYIIIGVCDYVCVFIFFTFLFSYLFIHVKQTNIYIYICNNSTSNCVKPGELTNVPCANWDNTCWYHWQLLSLLDRQCIFASSLQPMVISIWEPPLETMVLPLNKLRRVYWSPKGLLEIFRASWNHRGSFRCWTYPNYIHITQCSHCIHPKCIDGENLMERTYK